MGGGPCLSVQSTFRRPLDALIGHTASAGAIRATAEHQRPTDAPDMLFQQDARDGGAKRLGANAWIATCNHAPEASSALVNPVAVEGRDDTAEAPGSLADLTPVNGCNDTTEATHAFTDLSAVERGHDAATGAHTLAHLAPVDCRNHTTRHAGPLVHLQSDPSPEFASSVLGMSGGRSRFRSVYRVAFRSMPLFGLPGAALDEDLSVRVEARCVNEA
jgi:hypothetical protein